MLQVGNMDLLGQLKTVTGFICYDWIEAPHKQAVIAETMDLLVRRVLVPDKGGLAALRCDSLEGYCSTCQASQGM